MVVFTRPKAGREDEYNEWYQDVHLPEMLAFEGIVGAQRYKLSVRLSPGEAEPYLSIYDIESDDAQAVAQAIQHAAENDLLTMSDAADLDFAQANIYEIFGKRVNQP